MLITAATNITLSDTSTGATNRSVDRDFPLNPTGLPRACFIVSPTPEGLRSLSLVCAPNRERIRGSCGLRLMEIAIISHRPTQVDLARVAHKTVCCVSATIGTMKFHYEAIDLTIISRFAAVALSFMRHVD
jgi:hypothetical protein